MADPNQIMDMYPPTGRYGGPPDPRTLLQLYRQAGKYLNTLGNAGVWLEEQIPRPPAQDPYVPQYGMNFPGTGLQGDIRPAHFLAQDVAGLGEQMATASPGEAALDVGIQVGAGPAAKGVGALASKLAPAAMKAGAPFLAMLRNAAIDQQLARDARIAREVGEEFRYMKSRVRPPGPRADQIGTSGQTMIEQAVERENQKLDRMIADEMTDTAVDQAMDQERRLRKRQYRLGRRAQRFQSGKQLTPDVWEDGSYGIRRFPDVDGIDKFEVYDAATHQVIALKKTPEAAHTYVRDLHQQGLAEPIEMLEDLGGDLSRARGRHPAKGAVSAGGEFDPGTRTPLYGVGKVEKIRPLKSVKLRSGDAKNPDLERIATGYLDPKTEKWVEGRPQEVYAELLHRTEPEAVRMRYRMEGREWGPDAEAQAREHALQLRDKGWDVKVPRPTPREDLPGYRPGETLGPKTRDIEPANLPYRGSNQQREFEIMAELRDPSLKPAQRTRLENELDDIRYKVLLRPAVRPVAGQSGKYTLDTGLTPETLSEAGQAARGEGWMQRKFGAARELTGKKQKEARQELRRDLKKVEKGMNAPQAAVEEAAEAPARSKTLEAAKKKQETLRSKQADLKAKNELKYDNPFDRQTIQHIRDNLAGNEEAARIELRKRINRAGAKPRAKARAQALLDEIEGRTPAAQPAAAAGEPAAEAAAPKAAATTGGTVYTGRTISDIKADLEAGGPLEEAVQEMNNRLAREGLRPGARKRAEAFLAELEGRPAPAAEAKAAAAPAELPQLQAENPFQGQPISTMEEFTNAGQYIEEAKAELRARVGRKNIKEGARRRAQKLLDKLEGKVSEAAPEAVIEPPEHRFRLGKAENRKPAAQGPVAKKFATTEQREAEQASRQAAANKELTGMGRGDLLGLARTDKATSVAEVNRRIAKRRAAGKSTKQLEKLLEEIEQL